jgi:aspartokinase-like uncharacterized kinase
MTMADDPRIVVKLGGSLLDMPGIWTKLRRWLDALPGPHILLVGGGRMADVVRQMDAIHHLDQRQAHVTAVQAMGVNAWLAAGLLERSCLCLKGLENFNWGRGPATGIVDPWPWLAERKESRGDLPRTWDVTSDSLAARLAREQKATRLYLLKSCPIPRFQTWEELAAQGIIDNWFPNEARELSGTEIVVLNFRDSA